MGKGMLAWCYFLCYDVAMITLSAQKRGSEQAKVLRRGGLLPAIIYGSKEVSTPIAIPLIAFEAALKEAGESSVITLTGTGEAKSVLIQEVVRHAVSGAIIHADLYAVEKGQTLSVTVPLTFVGVSPAVKELGGILVKVLHEIDVEAQPQNLPREIAVDISVLATLDSQIHVQDLVLPEGVTVELEPEEVVAMISVAEEEKIEVAPDISQIEVEKKGKKEEEEVAAV